MHHSETKEAVDNTERENHPLLYLKNKWNGIVLKLIK